MGSFYGAFKPFKETELKKIHDATLRILESTGLIIASEEVLDAIEAKGMLIDRDKQVVKFPPEIVENAIRNCRNSMDRSPGDNTMLQICAGGASPVLYDYELKKHRPSVLSDLKDASRLADALPYIDQVDFPVDPTDVEREIVDLVITKTVWATNEKGGGGGLSRTGGPWLNLSAESIDYLIRMWIVKCGSEQEFRKEPRVGGPVCAASPLRFGEAEMGMLLKLAREGQIVGIGSNVICGVQSPVTFAADIVVENAERMGALAITLAINPDAATFFCNHPNFLDMAVGNVSNGSPEHSLMALLGQALLNYYGFQLYSCHPCLTTGAHVPGPQAALEKSMHMLMTGLGGASGMSAAGCLFESFSLEQLVLDNEIAGMVKHYLKGVDVTDGTIMADVIEETGIGANFLAHPSTAKHMRDVYWHPSILNRKRFSEWSREGEKDALERAHEKVKEILGQPEKEILSAGQIAAMDAIIDEAKARLCERVNV